MGFLSCAACGAKGAHTGDGTLICEHCENRRYNADYDQAEPKYNTTRHTEED